MRRRSRRLLVGLAGLGAGLTGCEAGRHADAMMSLEPVHGLLLAVAIALAAMVVLIGASTARQAILHARAATTLRRGAEPAVLEGMPVGIVNGNGVALVAGIVAPATYCSRDLASRLEDDELRGVLLHEWHHAATRAPVRLILVGGIERVIGRIPFVAATLERVRAAIEIGADEAAIRAGVSRRALAGAILKLDAARDSRGVARFASASELRLRALIGEPLPAPARVRDAALPLAGGICVAVAACAALAMLLPGA